MELAGLHAKITGDSGSFERATTRSVMAARRMEAKLREQKAALDASKNSAEGLSQRLHKLQMSTDSAYAAQHRFNAAAKELKAIAAGQNWSLEQTNDRLIQLARHYGLAEVAGVQFSQQIRSSRFHLANLSAQFNDIGVMLAAGQSPLMLALQQGTQITQVMQHMGGTGREQLGALAEAFRAIIAPSSLLTIGIIAGGAALFQFARNLISAGRETRSFDEALGDLERSISEINELSEFYAANGAEAMIDAYGRLTPEIQRHIDVLRDLRILRALGEIYSPVNAALSEMTGWITTSTSAMEGLFNVPYDRAEMLVEMLEAIGEATTVDEAAAAYERLFLEIDRVTGGIENMAEDSELSDFVLLLREAYDALLRLREASTQSGWFSTMISEGEVMLGLFQQLLERRRELYDAGLTDITGERTPFGPGSRARMPPRRAPLEGELDNNTGTRRAGAAPVDPIIARMQSLRESLMTEIELEQAHYAQRLALLDEWFAQDSSRREEYQRLTEQEQERHAQRMRQLDAYRYGTTLDKTQQFLGDMATALQSGNERMLKISQVFSAGEALVNAWRAYSQTMADPTLPWFAKIPAAISVLGAGMRAVSAIKNLSSGGGGGAAAGVGADMQAQSAPAVSRNVAIQLTGGDMFSRQQVIQLINSINEAVEDGAIVRIV